MNTKPTLLATAGTIDGITKLINKFWFSTLYTVNPDTLAIEHPNKTTENYAVRLKAGRYRFESVTHRPIMTPIQAELF